MPLPSAVCVTSGVKSTAWRLVERSRRPCRCRRYVLISRLPASGCSVQKVAVCPNPGSTTWLAVRQVRQELLRRDLRRRREVELPADQERLDVRRPHRAVLVLVRTRRPGVGQLAAAPDERRRRVAEVRIAASGCRRRSSRAPPARRASRRRRTGPRRTTRGTRDRPRSDWNQNPLASPSAAESHESSVIGARVGPAPLGGRLHEPEEGGDPDVARP